MTGTATTRTATRSTARQPLLPRTSTRPHDHTGMRRDNLATVLQVLRAGGPAARAELARTTGLNKATVSSLVGELTERGLTRESAERSTTSGRPGQLVELVPRLVCGLGLEVGSGHLAAGAVDLTGTLSGHRRISTDVAALGIDATVDALAELATEVLDELTGDSADRIDTADTDPAVDGPRQVRPAGVTLAVPGLVDVGTGVVHYSPHLEWRDLAVAELLAARLPAGVGPVRVDNDANLAALAEYAAGAAAGTPDLVYLGGGLGIGAGIVTGGRVLRGTSGHTGEVGHLPMDPMGPYCRCGRRGCWETQIGFTTLLERVATPDDPIRDPALDLPQCLELLAERARSGDQRTLGALHHVGTAVAVGASALIHLLDPAVVVLGGYFTALAEWILPAAQQGLAERRLSPSAPARRVLASQLGLTAAVHGGAESALHRLLTDPTLADPTLADPTLADRYPARGAGDPMSG